MARVLIVDDSPSVRTVIAARLRAHGHEVEAAVDGESAAEQAVAWVPDVVVTDLHMKGLSGVQLCRILRNDPATAHVPVVLLTASGDKRSRFWARMAGAADYLSKDRIEELVELIDRVLASRPAMPAPAPERAVPARRTLQERMSTILDAALFESVVAGEVRALASAGEHTRLFEGLVTVVADILNYHWLAMLPARSYSPFFIHAHPAAAQAAEAAARAALEVPKERSAHLIVDDRALAAAGTRPDEIVTITLGGSLVARLALGPPARGFSREDHRTLALVANELAGPLQMSALYEDAQRLASMDALTGLLNRRAFLDMMERERSRSDRHHMPLSLLLIDVDHFKAVNDTRGHAAGDAVLQGVARVLTAVARKSDCVARWGGEEFVVALTQTGEAGARVAAERARRAIAEASHAVANAAPIRVTASVGVSSAEAPWKIDAIIAAADAAMYSAKERGRNRVESVAAADMPTSVRLMRARLLTSR